MCDPLCRVCEVVFVYCHLRITSVGADPNEVLEEMYAVVLEEEKEEAEKKNAEECT